VLAVRNRRALLERDEFVRAARQYDFNAWHLFEQRLQSQRNVQHQLRFGDAVRNGARVVTAVSRVDDDLCDAQAKLTGQRVVAAPDARRGNR